MSTITVNRIHIWFGVLIVMFGPVPNIFAAQTPDASGLHLSADELAKMSPVDVVQDYCIYDYNGTRLQTKTIQPIHDFSVWEEEPGWDSAVVVNYFEIDSNQVRSDKASVSVKYTEFGLLDGIKFKADRKTKVVVFHLVRMDNVWKITDPKMRPHASAQALADHIRELISTEGNNARQKWSATLNTLYSLAKETEYNGHQYGGGGPED